MCTRQPEDHQRRVAMSSSRGLCPSGVRLLPHFTLKQTVYVAVFYVFLLCVYSDKSTASGCSTCLNGGRQLLPNNIFGFCRCRCPGPYMGPRCQFGMRKRSQASSSELPAGFDFKTYVIQRLLGSLNKRDRPVDTAAATSDGDASYGGYYDMEDDF